jgi:hypothetical protein
VTHEITLDRPLNYSHYSATQQFGLKEFNMRAEIGLLSRNIVIQGEKESSQ